MLGDININLIFNGKQVPNGIKKYREFCANHDLKQIITSPTRITEKSSTLLDHILTNSSDKVSQSGVLDLGLSDHQLIYCTRKTIKNKPNKHKYIKLRSLTLFRGLPRHPIQGVKLPTHPTPGVFVHLT